jgi:hypothetical protein
VVGTGIPMGLNAVPECLLIASGEDGIDQFIAAAVLKIGLAKTELLQVILVIVQSDIGRHV